MEVIGFSCAGGEGWAVQVGVWEMVRLKGRRSVELAGKLWAVGMGVGMGLCMVGAWRAVLERLLPDCDSHKRTRCIVRRVV